MIEETHSLKCQYKGVTAYELSSVDCSSDKTSGYYGETATLTANEAPADLLQQFRQKRVLLDVR